MKVEVLTIGDEILIGQIVNTNAAWLGEELTQIGLHVVRMTTSGDERADIYQALQEAFERADLVITTGGLGPTHDDVTKEVVASFFETTLEPHAPTMARLEAYFERRGSTVPEKSRMMAQVPVGFEPLTNPMGTAPGLWYETQHLGTVRRIVVLPGVPREMKALMREKVLPRLAKLSGRKSIVYKTLLTAGIGESNLQAEMGDLTNWLSNGIGLAYLPSSNGVRLRLSVQGTEQEALGARLGAFEAHLRHRIGRYIYGEGNQTLEAVVGKRLLERSLTIATAESCTGGLVAHRLTNVSGSSAYMLGGVVAYANVIKEKFLGVDPDVLRKHGAVSEAVVRHMAEGVRERFGADIGVATSGIMGPNGGTAEKPVGTVWIGYADQEDTHAKLLRLVQDRMINKELTSTTVLSWVRQRLVEQGDDGPL